MKPLHGNCARLRRLNHDELQELTAVAQEARARALLDLSADPFLNDCMNALFERADERQSAGRPPLAGTGRAPILGQSPRMKREARARELLGCEHQDMRRFWPCFADLGDDELERLVNYLSRDADVWPDRDWTLWPPFPRLQQKEVRDCVASFPRYHQERDRRPEPLTGAEQSDANGLAAKVRLGVYRADWSKLSLLVAGKRFYGRFGYQYPLQGAEFEHDRDPGARARPDYRAIILRIQHGMPE